MGFALAVRVNEIWDTLNKTEEEPPNFPSRDWWKSKIKRFDPRPIWRGERLARLEPGFVVHLDAPWGGGKTSFAKFLTTILNPAAIESEIPAWLDRLNLETNMPQDYQRQWHIVQFNAWRHQHISPPWWVFYETIRRQCSASLYAGDGSTGGKWWATFVAKINVGRLWLLEYLWRLWSPGTRIGIGISLVIGFVVYYLASRGLIGFDLAKLKLTAGGSKSAGGNGGVFWTTLIMLFMGAAAPLVTIFKAFTSTLLPGTPAAAKNYSLGSGDP
ncbi:MAG: hypothetical protein GY948_23435, partial [Alphaproteobacteria bacterium]|nr:hypothetical protein [Alphaproteobacteria bacterium]